MTRTKLLAILLALATGWILRDAVDPFTFATRRLIGRPAGPA